MPDLRPCHLAPAAAAAFGLGAALALAQEPPLGTTPTPAPTPAPGHVAPRATPAPDVYHLRNGDRITGRTIAQTRRSFAIQTPFGRLTLPRVRVARVVHADGSEEVLHPVDAAGAAPAALPTPAPTRAVGTGRLVLAISGTTFWQAWDPREAERDPTLRLELRLDEEAVVVYADEQPDPDQIKGAVVNAFSFAEGLTISPAPSVRVHPPDVRPGRIVLKLDLAALSPAPKRLRLAYQINTGTAEEPAWKDVVSAATAVTIAESQPALVEVRQERGRMEFAGFLRRRMRHVDTFELDLTATTGADSP